MLETREITKTYHAPGGGTVNALNDVDVLVRRGRTLGVVGESGSGKTTLTRQLLMLETPTSGDVIFEGRPLSGLSGEDLRKYRHAVAAVFQNPYSSLDPRLRIWQAITEQQALERAGSKKERRKRADELLELVGLGARMAERYPHQLSGGQRQRVAIARAIAQDPEVVILDEPLSALDVSVSAQIVNLLLELQERLGVTYLFVGHDLRLVRHLCHDVVVMYRGKVVESGPAVAGARCRRPPVHRGARRRVGADVAGHHRRRRHEGRPRRDQRRLPVPHPLPVPRRGVRHGDPGAARDRARSRHPLPPPARRGDRRRRDTGGAANRRPDVTGQPVDRHRAGASLRATEPASTVFGSLVHR